ncbi:MAG: hypothetical protein HY290_13780 [Planctomycetia bacterium]|nr:hypothetical protein [Planctomycetia bacterium]
MKRFRFAQTRRRAWLARRAAHSLTEVLVVMTVASAMIGMSGTMIHRLLAAEHEATRAARFAVSLARLSRTFRADIHAARSVELADDENAAPVLVAKLEDGHTIRYELDANLATRIEFKDGSQSHRDVFHFAPGSQLRVRGGGEGKMVRFELDLAASGGDLKAGRPSRTLAIEAALARDHRFESESKQEGQAP